MFLLKLRSSPNQKKLKVFQQTSYNFLASESSQFLKQLVTKSKTRYGFRSLGNHIYIKEILAQINEISEREKVSSSLSHIHDYGY